MAFPLGKVRIKYQKQFFPDRVVRHWKKLLREVVELLSLEVSKSCLDVALGDIVSA